MMRRHVEEPVRELRAADQRGLGRVESAKYGVANIERLSALDHHASSLRTFSLVTVPGLLQTIGYSQATLRAAVPRMPEAEMRRRTLLRSARSVTFLDRARAGEIRALFIVGEQAFIHAAGLEGAEAHEEQLRRLAELSEIEGLTIGILPFRVIPPFLLHNFSAWTFPDDWASDEEADLACKVIMYTETAVGPVYSTRGDDWARLHNHYADLLSASNLDVRGYIRSLLGE